MTDITKQVVSLELAKELKANGFKQEGSWWWSVCDIDEPFDSHLHTKFTIEKHRIATECVAPTCAELGEALPQYVKDRKYMLTIVKNEKGKWWIGYANHRGFGVEGIKQITEIKLADGLSKMYLYLKKENLL